MSVSAKVELVSALVAAGANIEARTLANQTPLMFAVVSPSAPEIVAVLLEAGAKIEARSIDGHTPLLFAAAIAENPEVVSTLLRAGADAGAVNQYGQTALDLVKLNSALYNSGAYEELVRALSN